MSGKISVAVLLSSYNGEAYIEEQIDSILAQDGDFSLDLYVRDDGSQDGTKQILEKYAREHENVHVRFGKNVGITASYFKLIRETEPHTYYALSDQDDRWLPGKIAAAVRMLENAASDAVKNSDAEPLPLLYGCQSFLTDSNLNKTGHETHPQHKDLTFFNTMIQNILLGHNQVMNDALFQALKWEEVDYDRIYAHDMWITNLAAVTGKILFENNAYTLYRQHGDNELGFGTGPVSWVLMRLRRAKNGESRKVAVQAAYFCHMHKEDLTAEQRKEAGRFFGALRKETGAAEQKDTLPAGRKKPGAASASCSQEISYGRKSDTGFWHRLRYIIRSKFYRQTKVETILFRLLYLAGGYRI